MKTGQLDMPCCSRQNITSASIVIASMVRLTRFLWATDGFVSSGSPLIQATRHAGYS